MDILTQFKEFVRFGSKSRRLATRRIIRRDLFSRIPERASVLEIGPWTKPNVSGPNVRYFEIHGLKELRRLAELHGFPMTLDREIDYISPTGDLSGIDRSFDFVVSSHCIEHQPDLIGHLNAVHRLLNPGGQYLLVIPDKRYCFDHFHPESEYADVVAAWNEQRTRHTRETVIRHHTLAAHNDPVRHWLGDHGDRIVGDRVLAEKLFEEHPGYIDAHAWQFTPQSFAAIIQAASDDKILNPNLVQVYDTPGRTFEFCAILSR